MKTKSKKRKSPLKAKAKTRKTGRTAAIKKASDQNDIFEIILKHHKPLKPLFKTMKNPKATLSQLQHAFEEFAPLLIMHSRPEEKALYAPMKERKSDIRTEGFEGETEHHIADQLIAEIRMTNDEDKWRARVKVLAELVEHHIREEEEEIFPDARKEFPLEERIQMGENYSRLYSEFSASQIQNAA